MPIVKFWSPKMDTEWLWLPNKARTNMTRFTISFIIQWDFKYEYSWYLLIRIKYWCMLFFDFWFWFCTPLYMHALALKFSICLSTFCLSLRCVSQVILSTLIWWQVFSNLSVQMQGLVILNSLQYCSGHFITICPIQLMKLAFFILKISQLQTETRGHYPFKHLETCLSGRNTLLLRKKFMNSMEEAPFVFLRNQNAAFSSKAAFPLHWHSMKRIF